MADIEHSRLSRRTVLIGTAALLAVGIAAPTRVSAQGPAPVIRSAAARSGELLAVTADEPDGDYAIRRVTVDADRRAGLGERLPISLPGDFHPHSMAAVDEALWITGSVDRFDRTVTVDNRLEAIPPALRGLVDPADADPDLPDDIVELEVYRARPGLVRVVGDRAEYADLAVPDQIGSGVATAIASPPGALAVMIEGCRDPDVALITRSHLAISVDGGRTWRDWPIAEDLGEGYGTVLAATDSRLFAVTAEGTGTQRVYAGGPDTALELVGVEPEAGRPMAAVTTGPDQIAVFSDRDGLVHERRYGPGGSVAEAAATCCRAGEVIAIRGLADAWLEAEGGLIRARGRW